MMIEEQSAVIRQIRVDPRWMLLLLREQCREKPG